MPLERLVYRSVASGENVIEDFNQIIACSRAKNQRLGVTGAIALYEDRFVQVLEGRQEPLDRLLASIAEDARHKDLRVLGRWTVSGRLFPNWSMARAEAVGDDPRIGSWLKLEDHGAALVGTMLSLTGNIPLEL